MDEIIRAATLRRGGGGGGGGGGVFVMNLHRDEAELVINF